MQDGDLFSLDYMRLADDEYAVYVMNLNDEEAGKAVMDRVFNEISKLDVPELGGTDICVSAGAAFFKEGDKKCTHVL